MDNVGQSFGIGFSASQLYYGAPLSKNKSAATQSVSCKKKTDVSMRFTDASKPPAATKTVSGKKAAGSGSKNSHATSSSKPSQSLDSGNPKIQESIMCSFSLQINFYNLITLLKHCFLLLNYLRRVLLWAAHYFLNPSLLRRKQIPCMHPSQQLQPKLYVVRRQHVVAPKISLGQAPLSLLCR
jgi:hypothetical protein